MIAVVIKDEQLHVVERPDPEPPAGHVVVATSFAGINAADLMQLRGLYPAPAGWPSDVPGMEFSGRVEALGLGVEESLLGQRVCAIAGGGAQATLCAVPASHLIKVPDDVSLAQAGGFAEAFLTAYDALVRAAHLRRDERLVVSGASGGVGSAAIQIGRLREAHVIAVTRTDEHHQALRDLGADETITMDQVGDLEPVDVVLELVGAAHLSLIQRRLAPFARVVVIGVSGGGAKAEVNLLNLMATRATLTGSTLRSRSNMEKSDLIASTTSALRRPWGKGEITTPLAATFDLTQVQDAYDFFARPGKLGKVLVRMSDDDDPSRS